MMMLDVMTSLPQDQSKLNFDFVGRSTSATGQGSGSIITPFSMYKGMGGGGGFPGKSSGESQGTSSEYY